MLSYKVINHGEDRQWLLMLHGLGGSSAIWYKQVPELEKRYNLILLDFFGHGETREVLPAYTFQGLAREIVRVIDELGIEKVNLLGISLGSVFGCFMAVYHPERIRCMILGGAALGMDFRSRSMLYSGHWLKQLVPYMWLYRFFAWILMPRPSQATSRKIFAREARRLGGKEFKKWYRLCMQFPERMLDLERPVLQQIPKLFISGAQDHMFIDQVRAWTQKDPNAELHIIENAGHVCNIQKPEEFNRVCIEYLEQGAVGSGQ
ncbi:MAG: alpha/beta hydrolase [Desulfobacteraceae bacterium]|nr:alpha/beta hydrolase [Desulfobacteraceae bacterium]